MADLTQSQRVAYLNIVVDGEAALARWSASNPMRPSIIAKVADARRVLAGAGVSA